MNYNFLALFFSKLLDSELQEVYMFFKHHVIIFDLNNDLTLSL